MAEGGAASLGAVAEAVSDGLVDPENDTFVTTEFKSVKVICLGDSAVGKSK